MDDFNLYEISTAKFTGKSCDTDCFFGISRAGSVWKKCNIIWNIIQDIRKSAFVCTAQCKCDDLCLCFFNAGFYQIQ